MNRAAQQREVAMQQIVKLQNEDGGWSWFKGFPASREITLSILKGMSQLVEMSAVQYGQQEKEMQMKALKYLDKQMQSDYESLQKNNKKWQSNVPNALQLEFLYVRSAYRDIPELGDAREAIRFYTAQAEKTWSEQSLYGKGEIALLMYRNGKKKLPIRYWPGCVKQPPRPPNRECIGPITGEVTVISLRRSTLIVC